MKSPIEQFNLANQLNKSLRSPVQEVLHQEEKFYHMIGDQLSVLQSLIPYLQHRKMIALDYDKNPHPSKMEIIESINNEIKKILSL